jgi:hypothetical protein
LSDTPDNVTPFRPGQADAPAKLPDMGQCMGCGNAIDWRELLPMVGGTKGHFVATTADVGLGPRDSAARNGGTMCGPVITRWLYMVTFTFRGSILRTFVGMRRPILSPDQVERIEAALLEEHVKANPAPPPPRDPHSGAVILGSATQPAPDRVLVIWYQQMSQS